MSSVFIPRLRPCFWRALYFFYYVAYFRSYTKAATVLNTTQPSLSRAIKSLEYRLHTPLLVRSTRRVALTPEGLFILGYAKDFLGILQNLEQVADPKSMDSISLFIPEALLSDYLLEPLLGFQLQYPAYRLKIYPAYGLRQRLPSKYVIKIRLGFEEKSEWIQKPLLHFEGALYASVSYVKQRDPLDSGDLSADRWLLLNSAIPGVFEDMNWHSRISAQDLRYQSTYVLHSPEHLIKMAEADFGIMAWIKNHPSLKSTALIEVLAELSRVHAPQRQAYFSCAALSFESEGVQALYQYLNQHLSGLWKA